MNTKSIFNVIVSGKKGLRIAGQTLLGVFLVATLLITAALIYSRAATQQRVADGSAVGNPLASNPELMLAHRYAEMKILADAAHLAANPELNLARRYAAEVKPITNQAYLAANPELALSRRYAVLKKPARLSLLEANREQAFARHNGIGQNQSAIQAHLSANPELALARRFAKDMERSNELAYLAANPEVALARQIMSDQSGK